MKLRNKKTGEIVEYDRIGFRKGLSDGWKDFVPKAESIAEFNEEWEDYKLAEPLIKDEKIRKLFKEWATLFEEHIKIKYYVYNDFVVFRLCREKGTPEPRLDISIGYELVNLREGYEYYFEELCGEEE